MYEAPKSQIECENCGALLPEPDADGGRTCQYCGAHFDAPKAAATTPLVTPVFTATSFEPINADAVSSGRGCGTALGLMILLIILLSVGLPLYFAFKGTEAFNNAFGGLPGFGGGGKPSGTTTQTFTFLPGEPSGPAPYAMLLSRYDSGQSKTVHEVAKVDGKDAKAVWTSDPLNATDQDRPMLSDGTHLLLPDGRRVVALNLSDGKLAWQAGLSDQFRTWRMARDCPGCFAVIGNRVSAVSADGVLQSFDTSNGAAAWTRRLVDVNARVWAVNGYLLVVDGESAKRQAYVLDPATGKELHTFSPVCVEPGDEPSFADTLSTTYQISPVPGSAAVDIAFGSSPTCIQRWDVSTGTQAGGAQQTKSFSVADDGLLSLGALTFAGGSQGAMVVDTATAAVVPLQGEAGWEYRPLGLLGGRVATLAKSSRGTTKYAVAWFDPGSGAKVAETPLGTMQPAQGAFQSGSTSADKDTDFVLFGVHADKLVLVNLKGETKLEVSSVDPATGVATVLATNEVKTSDIIPEFGPAVWRGDKALVRYGDDNLWTIDLSTGKIAFAYP